MINRHALSLNDSDGGWPKNIIVDPAALPNDQSVIFSQEYCCFTIYKQ